MNISKPPWQCPDCSGSQSRQLLLGIPPSPQNSLLSLSYLKTCFDEIGIRFFSRKNVHFLSAESEAKSQVPFRSKWKTRPPTSTAPERQVVSGMVPRSAHKGTAGLMSQEARRQDGAPEADKQLPSQSLSGTRVGSN